MSKRYIIAGGSSGIGRTVAEKLKSQGHEVVSFSRRDNASDQKTHKGGVDVSASTPDFPGHEGPLDGLVYAPGTIRLKPFKSLKDDDFLEDLSVNLLGAVRTLRAYLPNLLQAQDPAVVMFSTVAVSQGMPYHASIAAAKGAVEGLMRSLAAEYAGKIRFNAIAPSLTDTPLAENLLNSDEKKSASAGRHPLKRIGSKDDIAEAAVFLLGPGSDWISGQVLGVDGGMSRLRTF